MAANGQLSTEMHQFRPREMATRAEFIKLVVEVNGGLLHELPQRSSFDDVKVGYWFFPYIEEAAKEKWVLGNNACLGSLPCFVTPNAILTRAEAVMILVRAFGLERTNVTPNLPDIPQNAWYANAFLTLADHCLIMGDSDTGLMRPGENMNRAEMVVMLHRVYQSLHDGVDCGKNEDVTGGVISDSSELELSLAHPARDEQTVRRGALNVEMLTVNFAASCEEDQAIDYVLVHHSGSGTAADLQGLHAYVDGEKAGEAEGAWLQYFRTEKGQRWSDTVRKMTFEPPIIIPACKTRTFGFRADIAESAQLEEDHLLHLLESNDVKGSAKTVTGNFSLGGTSYRVR